MFVIEVLKKKSKVIGDDEGDLTHGLSLSKESYFKSCETILTCPWHMFHADNRELFVNILTEYTPA